MSKFTNRQQDYVSDETKYYVLKGTGYNNMPARPNVSQEAEQYLDVLVDIADSLGVDDLSFPSYFAAISRLSTDDLAAQRSNIHLSLAERELRANLSSAQFQQDLIRRWLETLQAEPATTNESVSAMERRKAALIVKAKEYQDELNVLTAQMPNDPPITVSQLAEIQKQLKAKERTLAEKRAKVKAFQGLPPNVDVARHKLKNAREEQMKLIQLRDRLLDRMVSGVS